MKILPLTATLVLLATLIFFLWKPPSGENDTNPSDTKEKPSTSKAEKTKSPISEKTALDQAEKERPDHGHYSLGKKTRDGTGKYYMDREIAQVMGHPAIKWLERDNREEEEAPSKAIQLLKLAPDAVIADIGAGSGYYTFRLAAQHPKGQVIAVDIQPEMVSYLESEKKHLKVDNVSAHLGQIDDTLLAKESIDAAIMVDAYHEFSHPYEMVRSIAKALRPGGRLFLLEYRAEDPTVAIKPLHKMTQAQAIAEIEATGLKWSETKHDLPWQHFMIFEK
ncbi:MAG: class I SAM-dependent methyltransferase [Verrucomicrobiales bacterium]|jgi:ubiquinone/menaquinone biosynthesis C-methylase UbiE